MQKCLGISGLDSETLKLMHVCVDETLVYVLVQWIQQMILFNMDIGVIDAPSPIVSRVFQDLSTGIVTLSQVSQISHMAFPFPYAQTLSATILFHATISPFVFAVWSANPFWAGLLTFTSVVLFTSLNFIAAEIEQPFGNDPNDIDLVDLQTKFNNILVTMLSPQCTQRPMLRKPYCGDLHSELIEIMQAKTISAEIEERAESDEEFASYPIRSSVCESGVTDIGRLMRIGRPTQLRDSHASQFSDVSALTASLELERLMNIGTTSQASQASNFSATSLRASRATLTSNATSPGSAIVFPRIFEDDCDEPKSNPDMDKHRKDPDKKLGADATSDWVDSDEDMDV